MLQKLRFRSAEDAERAKAVLERFPYTELPGYELALAEAFLDEAVAALAAAGIPFRTGEVEGFIGGRALEESREEPAPPPWLAAEEP
jgi:hypothetical protein